MADIIHSFRRRDLIWSYLASSVLNGVSRHSVSLFGGVWRGRALWPPVYPGSMVLRMVSEFNVYISVYVCLWLRFYMCVWDFCFVGWWVHMISIDVCVYLWQFSWSDCCVSMSLYACVYVWVYMCIRMCVCVFGCFVFTMASKRSLALCAVFYFYG